MWRFISYGISARGVHFHVDVCVITVRNIIDNENNNFFLKYAIRDFNEIDGRMKKEVSILFKEQRLDPIPAFDEYVCVVF